MCGISGIISIRKKGFVVDLIAMNDIINYRGPDDEGFVLLNDKNILVAGGPDTPESTWLEESFYLPKNLIDSNYSEDIAIGFGHRRLSILDLSPKGHQPMCDDTERYWITFNGEIYNFLEIKVQLQALGHQFHSETDTEVILASYREWGAECQQHFNGMWAFAIYDRQENYLFLSRDRFGIKPFYYWFNPEGDFYFGSEIKQFTVAQNWKAILNGERAYDYLYYTLTDHTDETFFRGVYALLPGYCFYGSVDSLFNDKTKGRIKTNNWYTPEVKIFQGTFSEATQQFLNNFKDAIKLHLRADVPVGSALSGGLDSSSIVCYVNILLKEQNKAELQQTFSSCSEDEKYDERKWMDEVAKATLVEGHYIYPKGKDVFGLTEKLIWHMDEPYQSQSVFLGYHVFREAKRNNVVVLLNGQGADEYLSGYGDFRIVRHKKLLKQFKFKQLYQEIGSLSALVKIALSILYDNFPAILRYKIALSNKQQKKLDTIIDVSKLTKKKVHPYQLNRYKKTSQVQISAYQLLKDPLQKYLRWEDRNSMAHSVEARVPFLDYRLVEFARSLPLEYLDAPNESKRILVEAMTGILPEKVRQRKDKKGFMTPEERWFMTDFKEEYLAMIHSYLPFSQGVIRGDKAEDFFRDVQNGEVKFDYKYWHLLQFCMWMKVFNVLLE